MGKLAKRIIWFIAMLSMAYTAFIMYMMAGFCAANSGVELPMWGKLMSICANVVAWVAGAK